MSGRVTKHGILQRLPVDKFDESPFQVRIDYGDIEELSKDIKKWGLLQPILGRPKGDRYEVVHGSRRLRAVISLDQKYILGVIRELNDEEALLINGSENIHRKDLTPIEEGRLYRSYMEKTGKSIELVAKDFTRSQDTVRDRLSILDLPDDIQARVHSGELSYTKARQLAILTREPIERTTVLSKGRSTIEPAEPAPRTDRWYEEIRQLADETDLKIEKEVAYAAKQIREGKNFEEALEETKKEKQRQQIEKGGRPIQEIVTELKNRDFDNSKIEEIQLKQYRQMVMELIHRQLLPCLHCGKNHIICGDCGAEIDK